jgi:homoserine dehydrogenase
MQPVPSSRPLRVGLLGLGVVGSGTCRVLERNRALIRARTGREIVLTMASARNLQRARDVAGPQVEVVADAMRVVRHPQVDVVVEAIGGCEVARDLVNEAIAQGKHVVTANKALLAQHGEELFAAARARGVMLMFEGAVAVSIPIVKALREGLSANRIEWLAGILNGTSNFVLTQMRDKGVRFDQALKEAQRLGYAEADPRFDVEGVDAAHKLSLLASMAFGMPLRFEALHVEGISSLDVADFAHARRLGYRVKLLGIARRQANGVELRVHPALVPESSLLAGVDGSMNGVMVKGDASGLTMYYGAGAGSEQTASAVIADLVDVARLADAAPSQRVPGLAFQHDAVQPLPVLPVDAAVMPHYLRVPVREGAVALPAVFDTLAWHGIAVRTHRDARESGARELVFVTCEAEEAAAQRAVGALQALPSVRGPVVRLRVETLA